METLQGAVETTALTKAGQPAWRTTSIACRYNFATSARRDVQLTLIILKCVVMLHAAALSRDDIVELPSVRGPWPDTEGESRVAELDSCRCVASTGELLLVTLDKCLTKEHHAAARQHQNNVVVGHTMER